MTIKFALDFGSGWQVSSALIPPSESHCCMLKLMYVLSILNELCWGAWCGPVTGVVVVVAAGGTQDYFPTLNPWVKPARFSIYSFRYPGWWWWKEGEIVKK